MKYICKFCGNKFSSKSFSARCPKCGEDYFLEKSHIKSKMFSIISKFMRFLNNGEKK